MTSLNDSLIQAHKLNVRRIQLHQKRILQALSHKINTNIAIQSSCSLKNKSIISFKNAGKILKKEEECYHKWVQNHLVSCIPAAGAASRFFIELRHFVNHIAMLQEHGLDLNLNELATQFPFLKSLQAHVYESSKLSQKSIQGIYAYCRELIENYAHRPKLYSIATFEQDSFLKLKLKEQKYLLSGLGNVLVVPNKMKNEIQAEIKKLSPQEAQNWHILEQDQNLSTIRFLQNGEPYLTPEKDYSVVSGGHGELLHLFDDIADHYKKAQCLHIRNIDNIIGTGEKRKFEINIPLKLFYKIRETLEYIRKNCGEFKANEESLQDKELRKKLILISKFVSKTTKSPLPKKITGRSIYNLFSSLFYWESLPKKCSRDQVLDLLEQNCEKPLSVFGVVKKEKGDVGGGPVFAKIAHGKVIKFCMEMPHASVKDAQYYFSDTGKASYFNPVLVFFEMRTHTDNLGESGNKVNFVELFDEQFWLLAKREYKGTPVCYHETVLYELIGNSSKTNLVFVEVPRSLFKPHKSYLNCLEQSRKSYGF